MPIFVLFVSAGILFDGAFSLWVFLRAVLCSKVKLLCILKFIFLEITLLIFCGNNAAFSIWFSFYKLSAQSSVSLTVSIKGSVLLLGTNLGLRFRSSRCCWGISWFIKFKTVGLSKELLPVIFCILFPLVRFWNFPIRWVLFLMYSFSFDLCVMRSIVLKWALLNTSLNSCDKSFTLML